MNNTTTNHLDSYIASVMPHHTPEEQQEARENLQELAGIIARIAHQSET